MNLRHLLNIALMTAVCAGLAQAQNAAPPTTLPPAAPKVKSQKEAQAIQAVQQATDPDTKLQKIDEVLTNYADTEFKNLLLDMAVQTAEQKGDMALTLAWAQRDLDANPKSYMALLVMANDLASSTREFDLDKTEKLNKAEKYAKDALEDLKTAYKPTPAMTDDQWAQAKKQLSAEGWAVLGVVATRRKDYDTAATDYKAAIQEFPNPNTEVRLADIYNKEGKYDDAMSAADQALADPAISPQVKSVATSVKNVAVKMKAAAAKTAPST